jgi:hypothetical protein
VSQDLVEKSFPAARGLLTFGAVGVEIRMLGQAGLADYFCDFPTHHARDGMIQQQPAARAMIVDQIAQAWHRHLHDKHLVGCNLAIINYKLAYYTFRSPKINLRRSSRGEEGHWPL